MHTFLHLQLFPTLLVPKRLYKITIAQTSHTLTHNILLKYLSFFLISFTGISCIIVVFFGRIKNVVNKPLRIIAVVCIPVLTIATLGIALLLNKYSVLKKIDFICSYRFTYISMKIQKLGLSLLPAMTTNEYFKDEVVIDNGYAYVAIRYGIVMIIILSIIVCGLVKKYKNNSLVLGVIILVVIQNLIDNDLLDYSCLPFLILGLKNIVGEKKYGRIGKRNNECIQRNRIGTK